jgi:flagellar basal-body rod protein FlgB
MDSLRFNDPLLVRLLGAVSERGNVISNYLANANTPGFTPDRVEFESRLCDALKRGESLDAVKAETVKDKTNPVSPDGNSVVMEDEMGAMLENRMRYETFATILEAQFELIRSSVQEGR